LTACRFPAAGVFVRLAEPDFPAAAGFAVPVEDLAGGLFRRDLSALGSAMSQLEMSLLKTSYRRRNGRTGNQADHDPLASSMGTAPIALHKHEVPQRG